MAPSRFPVRDETVEPAAFSGRSCQSCTAFVLADCIALCCCPCCVVSFLSLALVKAPWMVGRRCLAMLKKRRCFLQKQKRVSDMGEKEIVEEKGKGVLEEKCEVWGKIEQNYQMVDFGDESEKVWGKIEQNYQMVDFGDESEKVWGKIEQNYQMVGFGDESEKIWAEFYQIGQWGFGRVSFSKQTQ